MAAPAASLRTVLASVALLAAADASLAQAQPQAGATYRNLTAGGPLRPGVYGRIEVRGDQPPPVIYEQPVIASQAIVPAAANPVYLYVPPGQVRKWKRNCAKWRACDQPVLFVRFDKSPSRWGKWRELREREDFALQDLLHD